MQSKLPETFFSNLPWYADSKRTLLATSFQLLRNLSCFNFPSKLESQGYQQLQKQLHDAFNDLPEILFYQGGELKGLDKEFLFERFMCLEAFQDSGMEEAFITNKTGDFLTVINSSDHLRMRSIDFQGKWDESWRRLLSIEEQLSRTLEFAYNPRFGFLTADPAHCGTGLRIQFYLHLPALIHSNLLEQHLEKFKNEAVSFSGIEGSLINPPGDIIVLQNRYTIGLSEDNMIATVKQISERLILEEEMQRDEIKSSNSQQFKELISRAIGLLLHSMQLEVKEALNLLSLIRLGGDLGWIKNVDKSAIDQALMSTRRAHLSYLNPGNEPIEKRRVSFLHQKLQGIEMEQ